MNNSQETVILNKTNLDGFLQLDYYYELGEIIQVLNKINDEEKQE